MSNESRWKMLFSLLAIGNFVNGIWMLAAPNHWYQNLPGRVPDFGPMNEHFVRDLGVVFVMIGVVYLKGAIDASWRKNALFISQLWFAPHALVHLFDTFRGLVALKHLYLDIPLCYAPPILVGVLQVALHLETKQERTASHMKAVLFLLAGAFLGSAPALNYFFSHGPACPCHAIIKASLDGSLECAA